MVSFGSFAAAVAAKSRVEREAERRAESELAAKRAEQAAVRQHHVEAETQQEANRQVKQAALEAERQQQAEAVERERLARLAGLRLYRSTRGYVDQHGHPVADEDVETIRAMRR